MSTEEDGVDESGRIMAPPGLEADPDGEVTDSIVDNGTMSSSRSRSGSSRSGTVRRASSENAAPSDKAETPVTEPSAEAATDATATESEKTMPLPVDAIGKPPGNVPVDNLAAKDDAKPLFTSLRPAPPGSSYSPPSSYPRPDWTNPERRAGQAPPLGTGQVPSSNGHAPGFGPTPTPTPGPASAVTGAAAGMANSVTSAWQRRGPAPDSNRKWQGAQARKPSKRQAMLTLARVEPWSVMKFSFVASVAAFVILFVAVALLYLVLAALGVFDSLENTVSSVTSSEGSSGTNISHWFSPSLILGYTAMLGAFNIVIITAICTVGSVIYNMIAKLFGGIEVTLRETD
jgi:hypothetical protein